MAEQKAARVGAVGRDDNDKFVGVGFCRVLEDLVLLRALVGVRFVGNDDVAVKGVLLVGVRGQGVDGNHTVADIAGDRPLHVVVNDPKARLRLILYGHAEARAVVLQKVKALERLLQCAADLIHLRAGRSLIKCQGKGQGGRKRRLDVFSRDKIHGLLKAPDLRAGQVKAHDVVDDELVVRQEQKRCAAKRRRVQELALLVADHRLDDGDDLVRGLRPEFPLAGVQV